MSGLEAYNAVKRATADLPIGSEIRIHPSNFWDLVKLTPGDLLQGGYGPKTAAWASPKLRNPDISSLGWSMGLRLIIDRKAPLLN